MAGSHILFSRVLVGLCISAMAGVAQAQDYVPGEVIIKLKGKSASMTSNAFIGKAHSEGGMSLKRSWKGLNMHRFALKPGQDISSAIQELQADPNVEYAEPNYFVYKGTNDVGISGDILSVDDARAMGEMSGYSQTGAAIDAEQAWAILSQTQETPVVAIIDTGIDLQHRVFVESGALWVNPGEIAGNYIDDDSNGFVDDVYGWNFAYDNNNPDDDDNHGTHVAGIVLGTTQNIQAQTLQPSKIKLMALKFLDASGSGTTSDAIDAIYYAVNNGAKVLNNSWGGGGYSTALRDAIAYTYSREAVFVAAAGNQANNNDANPTYPANYPVPNIVSVAATNDWDLLASFSNYGKSTVHMGSPGVGIFSTVPNDGFAYSNGTSMAAPFVAGVAALMVREAPEMKGYQVKSIILGGAEPVNSLSSKTATSSRLNVYNAVAIAQGAEIDPTQPNYSTGNRATASAAQAGGCGLVTKMVHDMKNGGGPEGPGRNVAFFGMLLLLMAPVLISMLMRSRDGRNRRRYDRYRIDSQVRVRFGDRELVGSVSSISLGGVQLNTDAWLEKGGVVNMTICSPDGKEHVQVEGQVVWTEENKYGVQFANAEATTLQSIAHWTRGLLKI